MKMKTKEQESTSLRSNFENIIFFYLSYLHPPSSDTFKLRLFIASSIMETRYFVHGVTNGKL